MADAEALASDQSPAKNVQHEKQKFMFCLQHALNNSLQGAARKFDKAELDQICVTLAGGKRLFNPHRNVFGLGNYDVNVLGFAVQSRGFELSWHDARKTTKDVDLDQYFAIIVNERSAAKWYRFGIRGNHWVAIRRFGAQYLNLDSKLDAPTPFESMDKLHEFLQSVIDSEGHILFLKKAESAATDTVEAPAAAHAEHPTEEAAAATSVEPTAATSPDSKSDHESAHPDHEDISS